MYKENQQVYWFDPADETSGIYTVVKHITEEIVLIKSEHSEAEVPTGEIEPLVNVFCCEECGSTDVDEVGWIKVNTGIRANGDYPMEDNDDRWCNGCNKHTYITNLKHYLEHKQKSDVDGEA